MDETCLSALRLSTPMLPRKCLTCEEACDERKAVTNLKKFITTKKEEMIQNERALPK